MKSRIIEVNGVEVTCYEDGSIEKIDGRSGKPVRRFGSGIDSRYPQSVVGSKIIKTHRLIAEAFFGEIPDGLTVDHINGVRSDNRVENLRLVSHKQNMRGFCTKSKGKSSKYRGVCWTTKPQKWKAALRVDGSYKSLGYYNDEDEAARAYNQGAIKYGFAPEALNDVK